VILDIIQLSVGLLMIGKLRKFFHLKKRPEKFPGKGISAVAASFLCRAGSDLLRFGSFLSGCEILGWNFGFASCGIRRNALSA